MAKKPPKKYQSLKDDDASPNLITPTSPHSATIA